MKRTDADFFAGGKRWGNGNPLSPTLSSTLRRPNWHVGFLF
ncbi:hypothetical protein [Melghirimyces algeriensis]|nr:hypothetical protein [Melghirimyces algeriensis]